MFLCLHGGVLNECGKVQRSGIVVCVCVCLFVYIGSGHLVGC